MRKLLFILPLVIAVSGCAKLAHISELLTLKGVSDEQKRNDNLVKAYDTKFFKLLEAQKNNQLTNETKKSILAKYVKPIYTETVELDGQPVDRWIYRQYVKYFYTDQVHLYFDADGKLIKSEYVPAPQKEIIPVHEAKPNAS